MHGQLALLSDIWTDEPVKNQRPFTHEASAKKNSFERQLHREVGTCGSVQKLVFFQNYLGTQVNFCDSIFIRMPWENCFAVPN